MQINDSVRTRWQKNKEGKTRTCLRVGGYRHLQQAMVNKKRTQQRYPRIAYIYLT